jgi:hypothetical protein
MTLAAALSSDRAEPREQALNAGSLEVQDRTIGILGVANQNVIRRHSDLDAFTTCSAAVAALSPDQG